MNGFDVLRTPHIILNKARLRVNPTLMMCVVLCGSIEGLAAPGWWCGTVARTSVLPGELPCRMLNLQLMGDHLSG